MSWCLISDAQLWFPEEGMAKSRDDEVKPHHRRQWTLSRNLLNFPTQDDALRALFELSTGQWLGN
jgi:hypothetical protein